MACGGAEHHWPTFQANCFARLESAGVAIEKYEIHLTEESGNYHFFITAINKPKGLRAASPDLPEFTLAIEKATGRILDKLFAR